MPSVISIGFRICTSSIIQVFRICKICNNLAFLRLPEVDCPFFMCVMAMAGSAEAGVVEIKVCQGGQRPLQPDDFANPTQIIFDLRCALAKPVACCRTMRERVSKNAKNLIEAFRDTATPDPPIIFPEYLSGAPPQSELFEYYTPRALIRAHTLLVDPRRTEEGTTTLRSFADGLWANPVEMTRADQEEDAMRVAESSIMQWPLQEKHYHAVQAIFSTIKTACSILEVRETGDVRGGGLYASEDLDMRYVNKIIAPYPGVPTPAPAEDSAKYMQDLKYNVGDKKGEKTPRGTYISYYHLDRSGTLGLSNIRLPLGQFANEPLNPPDGNGGYWEVHNAQYTSKGLKLLKPVLKGEQLLVCYGSDQTYARDWDAPLCCSVLGQFQLASEPVEIIQTGANNAGRSRRRGQYKCVKMTTRQLEENFERRRKERDQERDEKRPRRS